MVVDFAFQQVRRLVQDAANYGLTDANAWVMTNLQRVRRSRGLRCGRFEPKQQTKECNRKDKLHIHLPALLTAKRLADASMHPLREICQRRGRLLVCLALMFLDSSLL